MPRWTPTIQFIICSLFAPTDLASAPRKLHTTAAIKQIKHPKEKRHRFFVRSLTGRVVYRYQLTGKWRNLRRGMVLPYGITLQLKAGSALKLDFFNLQNEKWMVRKLNLTFKEPVNIRVTEQLIRNVSLESFFVDSAPKISGDIAKDANQESMLFNLFDWAWQRSVLFVSPDQVDDDISGGLVKDYTPPSSLAVIADQIQLSVPSHGDLKLFLGDYYDFNVRWTHPPKYRKRQYHIYLWSKNEDRPEPIATVESDQYSIPIKKPGSYYVQVTSTDALFQSKANLVHISNDLRHLKGDQDQKKNLSGIRLKTPVDQSIFFTKNPTFEQIFQWEVSDKYDIMGLVLKLKNLSLHGRKHPLKKGLPEKKRVGKTHTLPINENQQQTIAKLLPGTYTWWLEAAINDGIDQEGKVKIKRSSTDKIRFVISPYRGQNKWQQLIGLVKAKKGQTFYFYE